MIQEAHVLQPSIVPAPGEANGKDEAGCHETEEDVSVSIGSLGNRTGGDLRHDDAQTQVVDEACVVLIIIIQTNKVVLPDDTPFCFYRKTEPNCEESK